jgi:hypothetical protein
LRMTSFYGASDGRWRTRHRTALETVGGLDQEIKVIAPIWAIPEASGIHSLFHDFRADALDNPPLEDGILDGHLCIPSFSPPGV